MAYYNNNKKVTVLLEFDEALQAYHFSFQLRGGRRDGSFDVMMGFIQVIKAVVPASNRDYNPVTKTWTVLKADYESKIKIMLESSPDTEIKETAQVKPKTAEDFFYSYSDPISTTKETKESLADKLIQLLECSPNDLADTVKLKRLYRSKALQYHPDRNNGDGSKMSELNSVWSAYNG